MPVALTTLPVPGAGGAVAGLHADPAAASRHLSNHVLAEPECFAWAALLPGWAALLGDAHAAHERHNERTRLGHTAGESGQELYDAYAGVLREEAADAARLGWVRLWEPPAGAAARPTAVCLGSRAILMVFEHHPAGWVLKTGFIPGQGDPAEVRRAAAAGTPRANRATRSAAVHARERARRAEREAAWPADVRYFYRVVRPAVRFLRKQHAGGRGATERHYGLVYDRLPDGLVNHGPRVWLAVRQACGRAAVGV